MKKLLYSGFFFYISLINISGQSTINGVVYYEEIYGNPASGVEVSAIGCGVQSSNTNGTFILTCHSKKAGETIRLNIGSMDIEGKSIEVVNGKVLESLRIPDKPDHDPIEIIVCYTGERNKAALKFYDLLESDSNIEYEKRLAELEKQARQKKLDANAVEELTEQMKALRKEKQKALEKIEEQAFSISNINKDKALDLVKSALQKIENDDDTEGAFLILEDDKLEEAYELAREKTLIGEAEIKKVIEGYELKINLLLPKFRYEEATNYYEKIIEIHVQNEFNKEDLASWCTKAANACYEDRKYNKALEFDKKSIEIREKILDPEHADLATSYNNIALTYRSLEQNKKALEFQRKAISIQEKISTPKNRALAISYNNIALIYHKLRNNKMAFEYHQKCLSVQEEILDWKKPNLTDLYYLAEFNKNFATMLKSEGSYKMAVEYQKISTTTWEVILDPKHPDLASSYDELGSIFNLSGDYKMALEFQRKSIKIREEILDPKHPYLATSYDNIALVYKTIALTSINGLVQYKKALEFQQKSITIREEILDPKDFGLASSYDHIATTYLGIGEYENALEYEKCAIAIGEEILDPKHSELAFFYNNIAEIYRASGEYERALEFQQKSISIRKEIYEPFHPELATSYNNIALVFNRLSEYGKALEFHRKSVDISKVSLPQNHPYQHIFFNNLVDAYITKGLSAFKQKDYLNALVDFKALNIIKESSTNWNYIGLCNYYLKDYSKAIKAYEKAVNLNPKIETQHYYNNIGNAYAKNKQFEEARSAFQAYEKLFPKEGRPQRNWAMYYALQNEKQKALTHLQKAIELGYDDLEWLKTDDSMDSLREEPLFKEMIKSLEKKESEKESNQKK